MIIPDARITGRTKLFGVVGDPIAHSMSPVIQNLWLAQNGIDAVYAAIHLQSPTPADDLRALARAGYSGLNVSLPHKQAALAAASRSSPDAKAIGAANTLARESDGTWSAHNTDISGFAAAFAQALGNSPKGARVVLVGAGGSARAVVRHLKEAGAQIAIINRTKDNAVRLAAELAPGAETGDMSALASHAKTCDALVNAASLGHAGETLALPNAPGRTFFDLSYGKAAEPTMRVARDAGWNAHDGLHMLVLQAAATFEIWHGVRPDTDVGQAAALAELARRA
jgi:shikimate dehydrogenase